MPTLNGLNEEILRIRDRLHKAESSLIAGQLRMDELDRHQRQANLILEDVAVKLSDLSDADDLAAAVAARLLRTTYKVAIGTVGFIGAVFATIEAVRVSIGF